MQVGKYSNYYFFFCKNFTIGVCSTSTSGCFAHFEWQFGTCVDQVPSTSTTTIRFGHTGQQDQQQQQLGTSNGCFLQGGAILLIVVSSNCRLGSLLRTAAEAINTLFLSLTHPKSPLLSTLVKIFFKIWQVLFSILLGVLYKLIF